MPRVVLLVSNFPKLSETFILNKFIGLLDRGLDVHVVCGQSEKREWQNVQGTISKQSIAHRVHVNWLHRPRWLAFLLIIPALLRCLALRPRGTFQYLRRGWKLFAFDVFRRLYLDAEVLLVQPDLLHIEFGALAPERMYLKELLGCKILVSFRGYDLNFVRLDEPNHYQPVWEAADALHLLGSDLWERAQRRGCPRDKPHCLIPPAIDTAFFAPTARQCQTDVGTPAHPLRILSVGRLEWKKGYEYAFEAVRLLLTKGVSCEYRIIGDGDYFEALSFARFQMGLDEQVQLIGWQTREHVRDQMNWADVFVHSAISEGFCNAVIEAQSMSVPVVCSDADGLSENVEDGLTGFVTERRCPQALAEKLSVLALDPSLRMRMGQAGRRRVLKHFQLDDQLRQFEELYTQILSPE